MSIKHMYYRLYQGVFRIAVNFLDWTPPKIISGPGSVKKLPQVIKEKGLSKMMIVTDKGLPDSTCSTASMRVSRQTVSIMSSMTRLSRIPR